MDEPFFGFSRRLFSSAPRLEDYFPSASMEQARQTVRQCLERAAGWAMVVGAAGLGKTLLCLRLAQELEKAFPVLLLNGGGLSGRRELWQTFLYALGQPYRGMEEGELRLALVDYLAEQQKHAPGFILLLDEAHLLPGKLLEEIRLLSQMPILAGDWFRVLLAGAPVLEERVSAPRLEGVHQRIVARCYLEPWTRAETCAYIRSQLQKVAPEGEAFILPEAADAVFQATNGIPRLVNQLCDHALLWAWQHGHKQVDARMVQEAWADLQQLPPPSVGFASPATPPDLIEFGVLQEDEPTPNGAREDQTQSQTSPTVAHAKSSIQAAGLGTDSAGQGTLAREVSANLERLESHALVEGTSGAKGGFLQAAKPPEADLSETDPISAQPGPPQAALPEGTFPEGPLPDEPLPKGAPPEDLLPAEGSAEELPGSGPEHELFFAFGEGRISEEPPAPPPQPPDTPGEDIHHDYHLEAWDRLQQIEEALSEMATSATGVLSAGNPPPEVELVLRGSERPDSGSEPTTSGGLDSESSPPEGTGLESFCSGCAGSESGYSGWRCSEGPSVGGSGLQSASSQPAGLGEPGAEASAPDSGGSESCCSENAGSDSSCSERPTMEINPFAESFLEEQWIEDPYLQTDMEGQRPWAEPGWLRHVPTGSDKPAQRSFSPADVPGGVRTTGLAGTASPPTPAEPAPQEETLSARRVLPLRSGGVQAGVWPGQAPASCCPEPPLIVIEEEVFEEPVLEQKSTVTPVSRHEYRRLFARLRRG